jgi:ABC-type transporter lipoprotein component MlaA
MNRIFRLVPRSDRASPRRALGPAAGALLVATVFAGVPALGDEAGAADAPPATSTETASPGPAAAGADEPQGAARERPKPRNVDPLEKVNRASFAFNDALDRMLARPAARLYRNVVPERGRIAVSNVMSNFEYPTTALNSALQGKFKEAGQGVARFVVNATVGVGGIFDPATSVGLPRLDEDFGQTLGAWGVPSGPYLFVPGFGPSTLRDAPARLVDRQTNARHYIGDGSTEWVLFGIDLLDTRAQLLVADAALANAFDPYALVRNAYLQRREYLVRDGQVPEDAYDDLYEDEPLEDEPPEGEATTPEAAPGGGGPGGTAGEGTTPGVGNAPGTGGDAAAVPTPDAAAPPKAGETPPQPAETPPGA